MIGGRAADADLPSGAERVVGIVRADDHAALDRSAGGIEQRGTLSWDGTRLTLPLDARVARVTSGNELLDPRLVGGTLQGGLVWQGDRLMSDDLRLVFPGLTARLALRGDLASGTYSLAGPVDMRGLELDDLGLVDAGARVAICARTAEDLAEAEEELDIPAFLRRQAN